MPKKNGRNTKSKIVSAAWKLFYDNGYENTTIEDIIFEPGTSKGSFYHYFENKAAILVSLAYLFDEKYEELENEISKHMSVNEIVKYYAFCERAMIYDWCLCNGDYSLSDSASKMMPFFMKRIKN